MEKWWDIGRRNWHYLIRFENYTEDAQKFRDENNLNLKISFNSEMQKQKREKNLKTFYQNSEHVDIVNRVYARDFESLGYSFL